MAKKPDLPRSAAGPNSPWLLAVVVSIATFMEVLDTTIANVALQHIAGSLAASQDQSTYIITSYLVSNAIVLPISGWLSNVIGRKRYYMMSVALFTAASVACGFANSLGLMLFFRVLQGIGGGGLAPTEQSMFADSFSPQQRALAFSLYGFTVVTAPAVGPVLGGWLTDAYSWHWVFLINLPVGLLSLTLVHLFVYDSPQVKKDRKKLLARGVKVDYVGFLLVAIGFGCLQIVLDRFQRDDGFSSVFVTSFALASGLALLGLVVWELTIVDQPIVNLRLLKAPAFAISNVVMFVFGFIIVSTTQLLPQTDAGPVGLRRLHRRPHPRDGRHLHRVHHADRRPRHRAANPAEMADPVRLLRHRRRAALRLQPQPQRLLRRHLDGAGDPGHLAAVRVHPALGRAIRGRAGGQEQRGQRHHQPDAQTWAAASASRSSPPSWPGASQFHHERLAEHVTPYNGWGYGSDLVGIGHRVQQQAQMLSYLDIFTLLSLFVLLMVPLIFFLPSLPKGAASGGH